MEVLHYTIFVTILFGLLLSITLIHRNIMFDKLKYYYEYKVIEIVDEIEVDRKCETYIVLPQVEKR